MWFNSIFSPASRMVLILALFTVAPALADGEMFTKPLSTVPDNFSKYSMILRVSSVPGPVEYLYNIAPLTVEAGLNQTDDNDVNQLYINGFMVALDKDNYNSTDVNSKIAFISCDDNPQDPFNISPSTIVSSVANQEDKPVAILLYSVAQACCDLSAGPDPAFTSIWTMTDAGAGMARNLTMGSAAAGSSVLGVINSNDTTASGDDSTMPGGSNSAIAMSILYTITGLITLLFIVIITTGAIRAHRHPERYGPRASYGGRPRQGRAMGIARAVLETLPIVKFGDPTPNKADAEGNEMVNTSRQSQSSGIREELPSNSSAPQISAGEVTVTGAAGPADPSPSANAPAVAPGSTEGTRDVQEDLVCSICTENFVVGEDVRVLPCDHKFHPTCVDPWLVNVSGTCPLCRLDLRPHETVNEAENNSNDAPSTSGESRSMSPAPLAASTVTAGGSTAGTSTPRTSVIAVTDQDGFQRRRISRLLDWNRLRHASVDERIQALRQIRQIQQVSEANNDAIEETSRRARLTYRMREKFHIRTRAHPATPRDTE